MQAHMSIDPKIASALGYLAQCKLWHRQGSQFVRCVELCFSQKEPRQPTDTLLAPMRERRAKYDALDQEHALRELIAAHAARANVVAGETLGRVRDAMKLSFRGE